LESDSHYDSLKDMLEGNPDNKVPSTWFKYLQVPAEEYVRFRLPLHVEEEKQA
jgi:hypothetical protein